MTLLCSGGMSHWTLGLPPSRWAAARFAPPSRTQRLRELRSVIEPPRLAASVRRLRTTPTGDGRAVIVFPGFGAGDASLAPLRRFLSRRGHDARGWRLGINRDDPAVTVERCLARLRATADESGRTVNLVGWSLGGIFARELGRDHPELVERVATFGTPIYGPRYTVTRRAYSEDQLNEIEREIDARYRRPLDRPLLAIHSPNDGVVDWRSCIDARTSGARNLAVTSTHLSMGIDPDVWCSLAGWLAHDAG